MVYLKQMQRTKAKSMHLASMKEQDYTNMRTERVIRENGKMGKDMGLAVMHSKTEQGTKDSTNPAWPAESGQSICKRGTPWLRSIITINQMDWEFTIHQMVKDLKAILSIIFSKDRPTTSIPTALGSPSTIKMDMQLMPLPNNNKWCNDNVYLLYN